MTVLFRVFDIVLVWVAFVRHRRVARVMLVLGAAGLLAACARSNPGVTDGGAGFLQGLFNGFIVLFALIGRWFGMSSIYEVRNTGGWYDTGYVIGLALFFGGAGSQSSGGSSTES
jgi:hypothetical protein